jgi:dienelactone hydrolase
MSTLRAVLFAAAFSLSIPGSVHGAEAPPDTLAGPIGEPTGGMREQVWWVPVEVRGAPKPLLLETTLFRPKGKGPFPLVIMSHGSPRDAAARRTETRYRWSAQSRWFLERGFAVALPMRRGYAQSQGGWGEDYGSCSNPNYVQGGLGSAADISATARYFAAQPFIDKSKIILLGHSAGGWGSLAAASVPFDGLLGVVNFAGGRGSQGPNDVCRDDRLVSAAGEFGKTTKVPTIWIYAANDLYFGPKLVERMMAAYRGAGAKAEFFGLPAHGKDGHGAFASKDTMDQWTPALAKFLDGLPFK